MGIAQERTGSMIRQLPDDSTGWQAACDGLAATDADLAGIIQKYGYPPRWQRPNTFETVVHIILEQQVSLASALASLRKLQAYTGSITPEAVVHIDDTAMKACYVSRQKASYIRGVASAILDGSLDLGTLENLEDTDVRKQLVTYKGIGTWTVDIYLMMVLGRADIFPGGDLAALQATRTVKGLDRSASNDKCLRIAAAWSPQRTVATMLLWHYYLSVRTIH